MHKWDDKKARNVRCSTLFYFCWTGSMNFNCEMNICSREVGDKWPAFSSMTCPALTLFAMKKTSDFQKETSSRVCVQPTSRNVQNGVVVVSACY